MKKASKNNKTTLYQLHTLARVMYIVVALVCTIIPIVALISLGPTNGAMVNIIGVVFSQKTMALLMLIAFLFVDVLVFFLVFKTYLRLDVEANQFIIREVPGFRKITFRLDKVKSIRFIQHNPLSTPRFRYFTVEISYDGGVYIVKSWAKATLLFVNKFFQIQRLKLFCDQCNEYLKNRDQL